LGGQAVLIGGAADHVHMLASLSKTASISDSMRDIKRASSRWVHGTYSDRGSFAWQDGYGIFTVGFDGVERVKSYVARQAEHHRSRCFRDEFRQLLVLHEVVFDERYLL